MGWVFLMIEVPVVGGAPNCRGTSLLSLPLSVHVSVSVSGAAGADHCAPPLALPRAQDARTVLIFNFLNIMYLNLLK